MHQSRHDIPGLIMIYMFLVLIIVCALGVVSCDQSPSAADSSSTTDGPDESFIQSLCQALKTGDTETILGLIVDGHTLDMILNNPESDFWDWDGMTPLTVAVLEEQFELVLAMLEHGVSPHFATKSDGAPIHVAARWNEANIVALLLDHGADMDSDDFIAKNTPVITAAGWGSAEVVELLIERGADVHVANEAGGTTLEAAASSGSLECFKLVFAQGYDINTQTGSGNIPLIDAIGSRDVIDLVQYIIEQGGDVHFVNKKGAPGLTTMHMAAYECHREIVELLLSLEVDVDVLDYRGETPLAGASFCRESSDIALLLLEHGADVNFSGFYGQAPIHRAVGAEMPGTISLLLERGADVNKLFNPNGMTALMSAVLRGNVEIVKQLLKNGADPKITTTDGKTAASIAAERIDSPIFATILELLESYGE